MSDSTRRRILLLGPNGQVGWELRRSLQSLGEVVAVGRAMHSPGFRPPDQEHGLSIDLSNPKSVREVVRQVAPDLIVNSAAYTAVDKAEAEPELAMAINGIAPGVLAEEAQRIHCGLIHYSTDYVFDGSGNRPWKEDDPPAPINTYGQTKLAGEEAIRASGCGHLILRVSWVHGVHGGNFVKTMLRLAADRRELSIVNDQMGAPTSARVIADATANILAQLPSDLAGELQHAGGTFHLTCQGETSWHAFALEIFRQARERGAKLAVEQVKPIPTSEYPVPAARPLNSRMCCRLLAERFHLEPPPWQTALWHVIEELISMSPRVQSVS